MATLSDRLVLHTGLTSLHPLPLGQNCPRKIAVIIILIVGCLWLFFNFCQIKLKDFLSLSLGYQHSGSNNSDITPTWWYLQINILMHSTIVFLCILEKKHRLNISYDLAKKCFHTNWEKLEKKWGSSSLLIFSNFAHLQLIFGFSVLVLVSSSTV